MPKPRTEPGALGFSVPQKQLCIEILTHLAAVGQAAEQLLSSLGQDAEGKTPKESSDFGVLTGKFFGLREIPLAGQAKQAKKGANGHG